MKGAIIGDIIGSRFEFNNHRSRRFKLFARNSAFTDDTICTAATADWLMTGIHTFEAYRDIPIHLGICGNPKLRTMTPLGNTTILF